MSQSNLPANPNPSAIGQLANAAAASAAFELYKQEISQRTIDNQRQSLALFERYLTGKGMAVVGLADGGAWWAQITHGLVKGFRQWMLKEGYSLGSVNVRLGHVRTYARVAFEAGLIGDDEHGRISLVKGIQAAARHNVDEKRDATRIGTKKAEFNTVDLTLIERLLDSRSPTPRGRRDAMILALGTYIGLRAGEMVLLKAEDISLAENRVYVWRPKIKQHHLYTMEPRLRACAMAIMEDYPSGVLLHRSKASGHGKRHDDLDALPMTRQGVFNVVRACGLEVGIRNLSPHDLRHTGATIVSKQRDMIALIDWGGWTNANTALGYLERNKVRNENVRMSK